MSAALIDRLTGIATIPQSEIPQSEIPWAAEPRAETPRPEATRDPAASEPAAEGLTSTAEPQALAISWSPLDASYPGIDRASYRVTGAAGNRFTVSALRLNLTTPGIRLGATARIATGWLDGEQETLTKRVSKFLSASQTNAAKMVVAINADPFTLTDSRSSVLTDLRGYAVSNGVLVSSPHRTGSPTFFWDPVTGARMETTFQGSSNSQTISPGMVAVSGFSFTLSDGIVQASDNTINARSGLGLSADARSLYMVAISRISGSKWNDGATIAELGRALLNLGSDDGMNLDGGGSTQMAYWNPSLQAVQVLGGTDTRFVGQHLGAYYG